jgi:hypothetical protein
MGGGGGGKKGGGLGRGQSMTYTRPTPKFLQQFYAPPPGGPAGMPPSGSDDGTPQSSPN